MVIIQRVFNRITVGHSSQSPAALSFNIFLQVTMMSRITLNLMKSHNKHRRKSLNPVHSNAHYPGAPNFQSLPSKSGFGKYPPTSLESGILLSPPSTSKGKDRDRRGSVTHIEFADLNPPVDEGTRITFYPYPPHLAVAMSPIPQNSN